MSSQTPLVSKPKTASENSGGLLPSITKKVTNLSNSVENIISSSKQVDDLLERTDDALIKLKKKTGIHFAPIKIPLARRRQTFAVWCYTMGWIWTLILNFYMIRYSQGLFFYLYVFYVCWKFLFQKFHRNGGLPIPWFRDCFYWTWFRNYFPVRFNKLYDIPLNKTYIFGYHPHGIIGMGAWSTFACQSKEFKQLFNNLNVRLLTLKVNFYLPFFDLFISFMGICDASKESCNTLLQNNISIALVLGGAKESLYAHPNEVKLYLKNRKGFIKIALLNGSVLIPTFGFGENELYEQINNPEGSFLRKIQNDMQRKLGFAIPIFRGRGVFQYNFGFLPKRTPINVVFGKPIECPKISYDCITLDDIDKYHKLYMNELKDLFDKTKSLYYSNDSTPQLIFI